MKGKLAVKAVSKFVLGLIVVGGLLFATAGTFNYPNAWLFIALLFIPMLVLGIVLLVKSPALLEKRMNTKETQNDQKRVIALSALIFLAGFVVAALDFRFGWSEVPTWLVALSGVVFLAAYGMYAEVMSENAFLSRTVEIQKDQKVIDTGLYGVVRHPMYSATILLYMAIPLVLGSWYSFVIFLTYIPLIAMRIKGEEQLLEKELKGYTEYKGKVRYKTIPFIW